MRLFHKRRNLLSRIESLEETLGLFFVNTDYPDHKEDAEGYGEITNLKKRLKTIERKVFPKKKDL